MIKSSVALVVVTICLWVGITYAESFPAPPQASIVVVSKQASVMGANINIRKFTTRQSMQGVLGFYQRLWPQLSVITPMPPWMMIAMSDGSKLYNVQVQQGSSGSWGYLSVSDLPEQLLKNDGELLLDQGNEIPRLSGSQILDVQSHSDALTDSKTYLFRNSFTANGNGRFYKNYYLQRGWRVEQDSEKSSLKPRVLLFFDGDQTISFTISSSQNGSEIVANWTKGKVLSD